MDPCGSSSYWVRHEAVDLVRWSRRSGGGVLFAMVEQKELQRVRDVVPHAVCAGVLCCLRARGYAQRARARHVSHLWGGSDDCCRGRRCTCRPGHGAGSSTSELRDDGVEIAMIIAIRRDLRTVLAVARPAWYMWQPGSIARKEASGEVG
jgi:hypothetical protein